jgi:hypothetical protein
MEGWIRRHMRKYFWQRWHNKRGRMNALKRLKANPSLTFPNVIKLVAQGLCSCL